MANNIMWLWWGLTVAICAWKLIEGLLRPHKMLEWPFLASAMWAYFYGYMAYGAKMNLSQYLANGITNLGQLMPLLCLVGIIVGWNLAIRSKVKLPLQKRLYPYFRVWLGGFFFLMVGAAGGISVLRAIDTGNINYQTDSAYWYLLFYVGYPGLAMAIWALLKMEPGKRMFLIILTVLGLIAFMFPHVINARRGPLFPAVIVLLLVWPLTRKTSPNPLVFCGSLLVAGLVMLMFLQVRSIIYSGGSWGEAIQNIDLDAVTEEKAKDVDDNEYVNSCQMIGAIYDNGKYQYGTGHLSLLVHWIPRAIWKNKPGLGEGNYSYEQMADYVEESSGDRLIGHGASWAGVAESFVQYGVFCPFFWMGLSWIFGRVYVRARTGDNPRWIFCYVGFMCASHWLVSQSFIAAFVPLCCFQAVPVVSFLISRAGGSKIKIQSYRLARRPGLREVPQSGA